MALSINIEKSFSSINSEIERTIEDLNNEAAKDIQQGNYSKAEGIINQCKQLQAIQQKLKAVEDELIEKDLIDKQKDDIPKQKERESERISRGKRTSHYLFIQPLLQALVNLGGSGTPSQVEKEAFPLLKPILTEFEFTTLASSGNKPRWVHRLHWTRYRQVKAGLLLANSPKGLWEISEAGRKRLKDYNKEID
jgi:restriction system protein